eukprot:TRINITY_DN110672_c0_g1_i1.p1 TRINITY_DN110672_c0_g1~~TRINITY_DN110672_c0_g1_i1.p1  ORF type:complete len:231 (+),score=64.44 TRINITY_DN110672_c0_g1_i1:206-898(+)
MFSAIREGDLEGVAKELAAGSDVNFQDEDGMSPLMFAAYWRDEVEVSVALMGASGDPNAQDKRGMTPLMHAAAKCHHKVCEALVEASADVNAIDNSNRSVLLFAADAADGASPFDAARAREICILLLNRKADINHQDKNGCTALLSAAIAGSAALLPELLKAGADPRLPDAFGSTAVEYASANGHNAVVELLKAATLASEALKRCEKQEKVYADALAFVADADSLAEASS